MLGALVLAGELASALYRAGVRRGLELPRKFVLFVFTQALCTDFRVRFILYDSLF